LTFLPISFSGYVIRLSWLLLINLMVSSCKLCYFDYSGFSHCTISGLVTCYRVPLLLLAISLFRENLWLSFSFPFGFVIRLPRLRYNLLINAWFIITSVISDLQFTSPTHLSIGYYQAVISSAFCFLHLSMPLSYTLPSSLSQLGLRRFLFLTYHLGRLLHRPLLAKRVLVFKAFGNWFPFTSF